MVFMHSIFILFRSLTGVLSQPFCRLLYVSCNLLSSVASLTEVTLTVFSKIVCSRES
ncbi:hypothetical protein M758_9G143000 [Ceratodon purpureus]|uniref:Uncharacterized protein n=1 Tax=Ceratodon purpureus TaxID=3225 RepID=A0A8T0GXK1_CERPU|nr:hypothetical protein KC19_N006200 [Ceratodon purpureus]KAG0562478.1 hypothetical protein KC19_9G149800 [Ceratodon purpureus]KAG0606468.1 hypothetical protein M758_9G143000 [Ceratodon purpureus]